MCNGFGIIETGIEERSISLSGASGSEAADGSVVAGFVICGCGCLADTSFGRKWNWTWLWFNLCLNDVVSSMRLVRFFLSACLFSLAC